MTFKHIIVTLLGTLLLGDGVVLAQTGGGFDQAWSTWDGGGGASSGGNYTLAGTIGQPDVGRSSGGPYTLEGGFWGGSSAASPLSLSVYLPLILK